MQNQGINLLPQEVFQKRQKEKKTIDQTMLLSSILPFLGIIVGVVSMMIGIFMQRQVVKGIENQIVQVEGEISNYEDDKHKKALLVIKTRMLKDVVKRDVNPEYFFNIVQQTIEDSGLEVDILTYGINSSGKFYIRAEVEKLDDATDIARIFRERNQIQALEFNELKIDQESSAQSFYFELSFNIIGEI